MSHEQAAWHQAAAVTGVATKPAGWGRSCGGADAESDEETDEVLGQLQQQRLSSPNDDDNGDNGRVHGAGVFGDSRNSSHRGGGVGVAHMSVLGQSWGRTHAALRNASTDAPGNRSLDSVLHQHRQTQHSQLHHYHHHQHQHQQHQHQQRDSEAKGRVHSLQPWDMHTAPQKRVHAVPTAAAPHDPTTPTPAQPPAQTQTRASASLPSNGGGRASTGATWREPARARYGGHSSRHTHHRQADEGLDALLVAPVGHRQTRHHHNDDDDDDDDDDEEEQEEEEDGVGDDGERW